MSLDSSAGRADSNHENSVSAFLDGIWSSVKQPIDGTRQLVGGHIDTEPQNDSTSANVGRFIGSAALYIGTTALASKISVIGKFAPMVAGGSLGFLAPVSDNSLSIRLESAGIGVATAATLQFAPGMLGKAGLENRIGQLAISSAGAGAINTNLESLARSGQLASLSDTSLSAGTWALTGLAMHAVSAPFRSPAGGPIEKSTAVNPKFPLATPIEQAPQDKPLGPGFWQINLESEGLNRRYDLHIPEGYDPAKPTPLVVMMDGVTPLGPGSMAFETGFNARSNADNVVVAYPYAANVKSVPLAGKMYTWNEPGTGISNTSQSYSDFRFLDSFLSDVRSRVNIDGAKIGGAGFSEGSMVLQKYATERPGLFSALGSIHGTINGTEAVPLDATGRPIPQNVVIVHSATDHMLPYKGGRGFMTAFLPQVSESKPFAQAQFWARVNQTEAPAVKLSTPVYDRTDWIAKDGQHQVSEYVIKGGQHAIEGSPAPGLPLVGRPLSPDKFDAPATVWKFITGAKIARSLTANVTAIDTPARAIAA